MTDEERASHAPGWAGTVVGLLVVSLVVFSGEGFQGRPTRPTGRGEPLSVIVSHEGAPVAGALVLVEGPNEQTRTDAHGRATVRAPGGRYALRVEAEGLARDRRTVELGRVAKLALTLLPETVVQGSILDTAGAPLEGATALATLDADPGAPPYPAKVEPDGTFLITHLPRDRVVITADAPGHESESRLVDTRRAPIERQAFALATSGVLVVRIVHPDGRPAAAATLEIAGSGTRGSRSFVADDAGIVRWEGVRTGEYEARARLPGLVSSHSTGIAVEAGTTSTIELRLAPAMTLDGFVTANDGPVANAEIVVTDDVIDAIPRSTRTDADGRFRIEGVLPQSLYVTARASGHLPFGPSAAMPSREPLRIRLDRAAIVRGRVIDIDGAPVVGAIVELATTRGAPRAPTLVTGAAPAAPSVELRPAGELGTTSGRVPTIPLLAIAGSRTVIAPLLPSSAAALGSTATTTDPRGEFVLTNVPPGVVQVAVEHPLHPTALSDARRVEEGATIDGLVITLGNAGTVEGRVVDSRGFPVPALAVELRSEREIAARTTVTERDGSFSFGGVVGVAYVTALPGGVPATRARADVVAGSIARVELVLEDVSATVEGRVVDDHGFPVADAEVSVTSLRARTPRALVATSASDGSFEVAGLPAPPYRIEARRHGYAPSQLDDVMARDRLELVLVAGGVVEGRVLSLADDAPVRDASVRITASGRVVREESGSASGTFRIADLASGHYVARIGSPTHLSVERTFDISAPSRTRRDVDLGDVRLGRSATIRGTVTDAIGELVGGATVKLATGPETVRATSAADGRYVLVGVPEGTHVVEVSHPTAGTSRARGSVRIGGGDDLDSVDVRLPGRVPSTVAIASARARAGVAAEIGTSGDGLVLTWIGPGSAADRAGLRVGDFVAAVDGERVSRATRANALLAGPVGVDAVLLVLRRGRETRVLVARESYQR